MNAKTWAPLVAAIVMGAVAAKVGLNMLAKRAGPNTVTQHVVHVVIAKENIVPGSAIKPSDVSVGTVPENTALAGTFRSIEEIVGRVTTVSVIKGQAIVENFLAPQGSTKGLTAIVPDGMRAVTLEVTEVSGVAGLLVPGCRVDVVSTFGRNDGQMLTRMVARDLKIIAVGRRISDSGKDEAPDAPCARNVTLLVTPRQAQVVDLAAHTGTPRLVLRGSRDSHNEPEAEENGVTLAELVAPGSQGWFHALGIYFEPFSKAISAQVPAKTTVVATGNPTTPTTNPSYSDPTTRPSRPFRAVTLIRNTNEQTVLQFMAPKEQPMATIETQPTDK
jgi:pilus assembly protein CpaB